MYAFVAIKHDARQLSREDIEMLTQEAEDSNPEVVRMFSCSNGT